MNGIKMSDCKFYVNEEERTVVCVIPAVIKKNGYSNHTKDMVKDFIEEHCDFPNISLWDALNDWDGNLVKELDMPRSFVGKAVCAPEDEWDEELGKMIAFAKAKDKCYKSFFRRANKFVQEVDRRLGDAIEILNNFGLKLEHKRDALQAQIEERTNK